MLSNLPHCKRPGLFCQGCADLIQCIETEPGKFEENKIQSCSAGETCLIDRCTTEPNAKCKSTEQFKCTGTGTFPDPFDCQVYHVCVKGNDIIVPPKALDPIPKDFHAAIECEGDYGYNILQQQCANKLKDGICPVERPVPACLRLGFSGALPGTSYYYVCGANPNGELRPEMHLCPHGTKFQTTGKCA